VAEGVETALHAQIVREFDSDAAQGYFFAPPLDVDRATELANTPDLRFPLDGPGWQDDGVAWPAELQPDAHRGQADVAAAIDAAIGQTLPLTELGPTELGPTELGPTGEGSGDPPGPGVAPGRRRGKHVARG